MKVTLLGDSIRMIGYGLKTPEMLGEGFEVFQPRENCRFAKYTLRGLFDWKKDMAGSRIVHWNNGIWDLCDCYGDGLLTSEAEYVENMLRIAELLLEYHDKVIFATTTPVGAHSRYVRNADVERYNSLIVPRLEEKGVIINDLYSLVASDMNRYIREDDHVHLSDEGIAACARQVADIIREVASTIDADHEEKERASDDYFDFARTNG